jgi:lipid A 3-O-deacylase
MPHAVSRTLSNRTGSSRKAGMVLRICLFCSVATLAAFQALAQDRSIDHRNSLTLYWENDLFAQTDRDYTNGLRLTWSRHLKSAGEQIPPDSFMNDPFVRRLPYFKDPGADLGFSLAIGQSIYTPTDKYRNELLTEDRPYAGYLYLGMGLHASRGIRLTMWELQAGVVGPWALGEQTQNGIHRIIRSDRANGWDNQLNNEPALLLVYGTKWRIWDWKARCGLGMELIPHASGRLGNVAVDATAGAEFRLGWGLPGDFGTCPIHAGCDSNHMTFRAYDFGRIGVKSGVHLFFSVREYMVLHDIFLDGNTFGSSHSVDRKLFFSEASVGIALHYKRSSIAYSYVWRSRQFEEQEKPQVFGSLKISFDY